MSTSVTPPDRRRSHSSIAGPNLGSTSNTHLEDSFATQHRAKKAKSNLQSWEEKKRLHKLKKKERKERKERKELNRLQKLGQFLNRPTTAPASAHTTQAARPPSELSRFSSEAGGSEKSRSPSNSSDAPNGLSPAVTGLDAGIEEPLNRLEVTRASVLLTSAGTPPLLLPLLSPLLPPQRIESTPARTSPLARTSSAPASTEPIVITDDDDDEVPARVSMPHNPTSHNPPSHALQSHGPPIPVPGSPVMVASASAGPSANSGPSGSSGLVSAPPPVSPEQRRRRRRDLPVPVSSAAEPIVIEDEEDGDLRVVPGVRPAGPVVRQRSRADERFCELYYYGPRREPVYQRLEGLYGPGEVLLEGGERRIPGRQPRASCGKGFGLRATSAIRNGQVIVHESPLLIVTDSDISGVPALFDALSDEERRICLSFPWTTEDEDPFVGMISTNFIPHTGPNGEDQSAIFEYISRTNHSCCPNSHWYWDGEAQERYLMALRDIQAGEEITASYVDEFDLLKSRAKRRQILRELHEFQCLCPACDVDLVAGRTSDKNRKRIMDLLVRWESVRTTEGINALAREPAIVDEISDVVRLLKQEKVEIHLDYPIEILFQIHAAYGRRELARDTAKVLVQTLRRKAGRRRDKTWEEMKWARNPESWHGYGSLLMES